MSVTGADSTTVENVRALRDRPFELLKALEKRSRALVTSTTPEVSQGNEWVGVAFRMGGETFLVAREETREVLGYPTAVTRVPGAKIWVKGLANVRGQLLPMVDLRQFHGRRGAGIPAVCRARVQRRAASDRHSLRRIPRRRLSPRG